MIVVWVPSTCKLPFTCKLPVKVPIPALRFLIPISLVVTLPLDVTVARVSDSVVKYPESLVQVDTLVGLFNIELIPEVAVQSVLTLTLAPAATPSNFVFSAVVKFFS